MRPISHRLAVVAGLSIAALLAATPAAAATIIFTGVLSGAAEAPPNASAGSGTVTVTFDDAAHTLRVQSTFANLTGTTSNAHIHAATLVPGTGTAGVATQTPSFVGFPLGVTAGTFDNTYSTLAAATYNPSYVTANGGTAAGAEMALVAAMNQGRTYFNIHTSAFPGGEIRAFLTPVPEPATWMMLIAGFGVVGAGLRRDRRVTRRASALS